MENTEGIWKATFLTVILGVIGLALALSVFFYVRSREAIWDNRSKLSRLIASNHHVGNLGTEIFTMFGSGAGITINGSPTIENQNTPYILEGGVYLIEIIGFSRNTLTDAVSSFSSKLVVDKNGTGTLTKLTASDTQISPTVIAVQPVTGSDTFQTTLNGNRLEIAGGNPDSQYSLTLRILGRK